MNKRMIDIIEKEKGIEMVDSLITGCVGLNCKKKYECLRYAEDADGRPFADLSPGIFEECESYIDKKRYEGKL